MLYEVTNWLVLVQVLPQLLVSHKGQPTSVHISRRVSVWVRIQIVYRCRVASLFQFHTPNDSCCHVCCTLQEQRLVQVNNLFEEMDDRRKVRMSAVRDDQRFLFK